MNERIVDIVAWAISQLQQKKLDQKQFEILEANGFTQNEISIAFSWLSDRIDTYKDRPNEFIWSIVNPPQSYRFFTDEEKDFFTPEAYNTIIKFIAIGLIRPMHVEVIINKAESLGFYKISSDMVRQFVAFFMLDVPLPEENIIRWNLCGNEPIN